MDRSKIEAKLADIAVLIEEAEKAAYARGFQDALAKVTAIANRIEAIPPGEYKDTPLILRTPKVENKQEPRDGSDQAKVLKDIREHPGSRGFEIVKRLEGQIQERTIRTSIHRLKTRGAISKQDDNWFPATLPEKDEGRLSSG